jgi:hypothetical protein
MRIHLKIQDKFLKNLLEHYLKLLGIKNKKNINHRIKQVNNVIECSISYSKYKKFKFDKIIKFVHLIKIFNFFKIKFNLFELLENKYICSDISEKNINVIYNNNKEIDQSKFNKIIKQYHNIDNLKIKNNNIKKLENLYCFCFFGSNIFHYWIMSVLPLFIDLCYKNHNQIINIAIDKNYKNIFLQICEILEIPTQKINLIEFTNMKIEYFEYCYEVKKLYIPLIMGTATNKYNKIILNYLKYNLSIKYNNNIKRKIFIERNYNSKFILGNKRCITNKNEIKELLKKNNYEIFDTENLSIVEKFKKINNAKIVIVEAGSTLVNLYFTLNKDTKLIILNSYGNYHFHAHTTVTQPKIFFDEIVQIIGESENKKDIQSKFKIDLDELKKHI